MKLDEEHKRRDEGEARAALARSAAMSQQPAAVNTGAYQYGNGTPNAAAAATAVGAVGHVQLGAVPPAPQPRV